MIKRFFLLSLLLLCSVIVVGQTPQQLQQLQNLSPEQIEELMSLQGGQQMVNSLPAERITDNTNRTRTYSGQDSLSFSRMGRESQDSPYDELLQQLDGDSISVSKEEYVELKKLEHRRAGMVYGREMFQRDNLTFAPSLSIATPQDYVISSGDVLIIVIWGAVEAEYELTVSPEGNIFLPSVGLVQVRGLTIEAAEKRIRTKYISANGTSSSEFGALRIKITLGDIRSITVNIVGEALTPGTYTLPSLSTILNALYVAGGVSDIGSLRDIKLYRRGELITELDVYEYLTSGRSDFDARLEDNDVIVVSPYQNIVLVEGSVRRPMMYEMTRDETVADIISLAGGFTGDAYSTNVELTRRAGGKQMSFYTVAEEDFDTFRLLDKDSLSIGEVVEIFSNRISIEGAVWRPGYYELRDSLSTVSQLIEIAQGLSDDAFAGRAQIVRTRADKSLQIIPINIAKILMGSAPDVKLEKDDRVIVASIDDMREGETVTIRGEVNEPQTMPYAQGMTIEDIILLSRGLKNSASLARIDIARRITDQDALSAGNRRAEIFSFEISKDLSLRDSIARFELMPYDEVYVRRSPGYVEQQVIEISGEVNFTGQYAMVTAADRLTDLVEAAGGLNPQAYAQGASLQRQYTFEDVVRIESLKKLSKMSQQETQVASDNQGSQQVLLDESIKEGDYYSVGIDLASALLNPESSANLTLRAGDKLFVPTYNNTVSITGAVYYPTTMTYEPHLSIKSYIKRAGGYSSQALRKPFVIEMNGNVKVAKLGDKLTPGSQIVVPFRPYRQPMSTQGWISVSSSVVSMAAMIVSLLK